MVVEILAKIMIAPPRQKWWQWWGTVEAGETAYTSSLVFSDA